MSRASQEDMATSSTILLQFYDVNLTIFAENGRLPLLAATDWSSPL